MLKCSELHIIFFFQLHVWACWCCHHKINSEYDIAKCELKHRLVDGQRGEGWKEGGLCRLLRNRICRTYAFVCAFVKYKHVALWLCVAIIKSCNSNIVVWTPIIIFSHSTIQLIESKKFMPQPICTEIKLHSTRRRRKKAAFGKEKTLRSMGCKDFLFGHQ